MGQTKQVKRPERAEAKDSGVGRSDRDPRNAPHCCQSDTQLVDDKEDRKESPQGTGLLGQEARNLQPGGGF